MRTIDFDIVLTAIVQARFGDTHEGSLGVRVLAWVEEPAPAYVPEAAGGEPRPTTKTNRTDYELGGRTTEAQVRGKRADWADYSGETQGEKPVLQFSIMHPTGGVLPTGTPGAMACSQRISLASGISETTGMRMEA